MGTLSVLQMIIGIISSLTVGGIIGSIVGFQYLKKREFAKTKQEIEQAESLELANTRSLIEMYKNALVDFQTINESNKQSFTSKLDEVQTKLNECQDELERNRKKIRDQEKIIEDLTRNQLKLKLDLQSLHSQSKKDCSDCSFKDVCDKLKAKELINE